MFWVTWKEMEKRGKYCNSINNKFVISFIYECVTHATVVHIKQKACLVYKQIAALQQMIVPEMKNSKNSSHVPVQLNFDSG